MRLPMLAALLLPLQAFAQPAAGIYNLTGTNPDGTPYSGLLILIDKAPDTYQVEWDISGQRISGWGMAQGDALAASYVLDGRIGVVLYRQSGNAWHGVWSVADGGGGTETITPR